jgi:hypothetical protein
MLDGGSAAADAGEQIHSVYSVCINEISFAGLEIETAIPETHARQDYYSPRSLTAVRSQNTDGNHPMRTCHRY